MTTCIIAQRASRWGSHDGGEGRRHNKKVEIPYNAADARHGNFPWQSIAVLNFFITIFGEGLFLEVD